MFNAPTQLWRRCSLLGASRFVLRDSPASDLSLFKQYMRPHETNCTFIFHLTSDGKLTLIDSYLVAKKRPRRLAMTISTR